MIQMTWLIFLIPETCEEAWPPGFPDPRIDPALIEIAASIQTMIFFNTFLLLPTEFSNIS